MQVGQARLARQPLGQQFQVQDLARLPRILPLLFGDDDQRVNVGTAEAAVRYELVGVLPRYQLIGDETMNRGTVDHAPVYPREVVRRALELSASAVILVHNHPSGDPTPSQADITMTREVVEAARSLRIAVHDHLVVGRQGVASFRALGLL